MRTATEWIIRAVFFLLVVWDCVAYASTRNGTATESVVVGTWMVNCVFVCLFAGGLLGHLAASGPTTLPWTHWLALIGAFVFGYWATLRYL